jgi:hypothetical protein
MLDTGGKVGEEASWIVISKPLSKNTLQIQSCRRSETSYCPSHVVLLS